MSKFVAIIDDENYTCPLEHEGHCHIAWNKYYKCTEDCDGVLNNRPEFCPLKEYKDVIPIEWVKEQLDKYECSTYEGIETVLELWERENA